MEETPVPEQPNIWLTRIVLGLAACVVVTAAGAGYLWARALTGERAASPGKRELAFAKGTFYGNVDLFLSDAAGRNVTQLTDSRDDQDWYPSWSPDGQSLAFVRGNLARGPDEDGGFGPNAGAYLLTFEDGKPKEQLIAPADQVGLGIPAWSPDGRRIALVGTVAPGAQGGPLLSLLTLINAQNLVSDTIPLTVTLSTGVTPPTWSPDGSSVAFIAADAQIEMAPGARESPGLPPGAVSSVWRYDIGTRSLHQVVTNTLTVQWSPTQNVLATVGHDDEIVLVDPDGVVAGSFPVDSGITELEWSPDGAKLAALTVADQTPVALVFDVEDGSSTSYSLDSEWMPMFLSWSPDSAYLTFSLLSYRTEADIQINLAFLDLKSGAVSTFPASPEVKGMGVFRPALPEANE